jgi:hypothetical protein
LLLRIGYQLAALCPELFSQEQLVLSVVQRVGKIREEADVVGAEVNQLSASGLSEGYPHSLKAYPWRMMPRTSATWRQQMEILSEYRSSIMDWATF